MLAEMCKRGVRDGSLIAVNQAALTPPCGAPPSALLMMAASAAARSSSGTGHMGQSSLARASGASYSRQFQC